MIEKCFFNVSFRSCMALTKKNCQGCSFYKTRDEFEQGEIKAAEMLKKKGLEPHLTESGIMSTRPIEKKNEYNRIFTKDIEIGENET